MWYCSVSLVWKQSRARLVERGVGRHSPAVGGRGDEAFGQLDDAGVVEVAGGADDDLRAGVAGAAVALDVRDRDRGDHLGLAEHAAAQRVRAEDGLGEDVVDAVLRLVLVHRDLLQHHLALGVDVGVGRRQQHLREQVEDLLGVLVEEAGVQVRRLLAGGGVDRGAEPVEALGDLDRRVARGPLEQQVLEEVRDPGLGRGLVARAGPHPEPERHGPDRGNLLGHDPDARAQLGELGCAQRLAAPLALTTATAAVAAATTPPRSPPLRLGRRRRSRPRPVPPAICPRPRGRRRGAGRSGRAPCRPRPR